jgi:hypothetical protein
MQHNLNSIKTGNKTDVLQQANGYTPVVMGPNRLQQTIDSHSRWGNLKCTVPGDRSPCRRLHHVHHPISVIVWKRQNQMDGDALVADRTGGRPGPG